MKKSSLEFFPGNRGILPGAPGLDFFREAFGPRNLWSWFNACTEVLKGNLGLLPGRTQRLHALCDAHAGLN
ncbi:MAG: hypothetical protein WD708_08910 [Kiritimatiellia bacterium]